MPNYDFRQLSPHDFEQLCRDLIQARDGIVLESFKSGRDQGIDFRHAQSGRDTIVQCKHYANTGLAGLLADLKKEAVKVAKLRPTRYILTTSLGLTPANKSAIQALFSTPVLTADILGLDDINNLLGLFPSVEQKHYKLWLASRVVLDRVVHNASITQSEFDVERVYQDIRRYVRSAAYPRALKMLNDNHVAIISGAPGVGKTTLAKMLLYSYLEQGYEAITILSDFQTGRERYQPGQRQIFYFDDFIGATFLGERSSTFTRNEDRAILDFIQMVRVSPTARLIMTTREHILRQAIATSEKLKQSRLVDDRCVLEINDYSETQRAEILYNHIYFSDLPDDYREVLLSGRFYTDIIKHNKFNPRLIDWLSNYRRIQTVRPEKYQTFIRDLLANPAEIWRYAYENQISDAARSILLALFTFSGSCGPDLLENAFRKLHLLRAQHYGFKTDPADWRRALNEIGGSFIKPGNLIEVIDPSVLDMLNSLLKQDTENILDLIEGAVRFEQARRVWTFARSTGNKTAFNFLSNNQERFAAAMTRLLDAPRKIPLEGGTAFIDDSHELRLGTLIEIAERLKSIELKATANSTIQRLLADWNIEHFNIDDGITLLNSTATSNFVFPPPKKALHERLLHELAREAAAGCGSDELGRLLDRINPSNATAELNKLLETAATTYRSSYFRNELRECRSAMDFEAIELNLNSIAKRTKLDFDDAVSAVNEALLEFEERQSAFEDHQMEEWKDQRHQRQESERNLDDLFDSLRKPK